MLDHVGELIERFGANDTQSELGGGDSACQSAAKQTMSVVAHRPSGFGDVLQNKPLVYSHIVTALDIALSRGRMPHHTDFPVYLQMGSKASLLAKQPRLPLLQSLALSGGRSGRSGELQHDQMSATRRSATTEPPSGTDVDRDSHCAPPVESCSSGDLGSNPFVNVANGQEDAHINMLHQLLEGYVEAGFFPN